MLFPYSPITANFWNWSSGSPGILSVNATWTNSGGSSKCIILIGKCYLAALWIETWPSAQQAMSNFPELSYFNDLSGLLNYENSSTTSVVSILKILILPDSKPHAKIASWGWAATQSG